MTWGCGRPSTEVYNLDKPVGHSYGEVGFYRDQLESCSGRVLEPAVGSGAYSHSAYAGGTRC